MIGQHREAAEGRNPRALAALTAGTSSSAALIAALTLMAAERDI
jgi:hypothetical protein